MLPLGSHTLSVSASDRAGNPVSQTVDFRVTATIDSLIQQLNASGIEVITTPDWDSSGMGKFARIHDPEGNAIELWEPPAE